MDAKSKEAIKKHYRTWSGGYAPDSEQEIFVYMECVHGSDRDDSNEVRQLLRDWMVRAWRAVWRPVSANRMAQFMATRPRIRGGDTT